MRKKIAFSLLEVMTLLMIISIVAAATIPLVTKRTLNESHGYYACFYTVNDEGVAEGDMLREIRVENKTEATAQSMISHEVSQCYFNFPSGNPKPKKFTITAIGAGANLTHAQRSASLVPVEGAGSYLYQDPDPEIRKHHILSDVWGYMMNPEMLNEAFPDYADGGILTYPTGHYGSNFGVVNASCGGQADTFCTATPGEYVRTVYRLNDSDPNEFQRLKIDIGKPNSALQQLQIHPWEMQNRPESLNAMKTIVTTAAGSKIVEAQGGYVYRKSNSISKIIVPAYDELACKMDGVKLCPQVNGCTMNDYRVCMDGGFIASSQFLREMNIAYPAKKGTSFWLTNKLIHTPGIFDGQPEFEAFNDIYFTGLTDSGCDASGSCEFTQRHLAFGDPAIVRFEKTSDTSGSPFQNILPDGKTFEVAYTYLNGSTRKVQNARPGLVFITW